MKTVIKGNNFKGTIFIQLTPLTSELDSTFIGLGTTISKKYFVKATITCQ